MSEQEKNNSAKVIDDSLIDKKAPESVDAAKNFVKALVEQIEGHTSDFKGSIEQRLAGLETQLSSLKGNYETVILPEIRTEVDSFLNVVSEETQKIVEEVNRFDEKVKDNNQQLTMTFNKRIQDEKSSLEAKINGLIKEKDDALRQDLANDIEGLSQAIALRLDGFESSIDALVKYVIELDTNLKQATIESKLKLPDMKTKIEWPKEEKPKTETPKGSE